MAECARFEEISLSLGRKLPMDPTLCMNHSIDMIMLLFIIVFRWLKQEYEIPFSLNKQPPVHMPIAYGLVNIHKGCTASEKTRPQSQVFSLSQDSSGDGGMGIQGTCKPGKASEVEHCSLCSAGNEVCCDVACAATVALCIVSVSYRGWAALGFPTLNSSFSLSSFIHSCVLLSYPSGIRSCF